MTELSGTQYLQTEATPPTARPRRYAPGERNAVQAYRAARRHSRFVKSLRYVLPALAVAGLAAFWFGAHPIPVDLPAAVGFSGINIDTKSVTMKKPHLSGFEGTRRAYEVNADTAVQSLDDPKLIALSGIVGVFALNDGQNATVRAVTGLYDAHTSYLTLSDGIAASTTGGDRASLVSAWVDIRNGKLVTHDPVIVTSPDGIIRSAAMTVLDSGKHVFFTGGVTATFHPAARTAPLTANGGPRNP